MFQLTITMMLFVNQIRGPLLGLLLISLLLPATRAQSKPDEVVFDSGKFQLHGFLWKPAGSGPFPIVVWNHGSEKQPGSQPALAHFYTEHSYVFFAPHRRGQGRSPGPYIQDLIAQYPPSEQGQRMISLQEEEVNDVLAAITYIKSQPFVDANRIAISGCSFGGIQTLLAGERELSVRALVPFAPGAMSWNGNPFLPGRLSQAVKHAKAPVFLLQADNDYNLSPSRVLSKEADKHHRDFRSKIYPAFGTTNHEGHWGFCTTATEVWGSDVLAFLNEHMKALK